MKDDDAAYAEFIKVGIRAAYGSYVKARTAFALATQNEPSNAVADYEIHSLKIKLLDGMAVAALKTLENSIDAAPESVIQAMIAEEK